MSETEIAGHVSVPAVEKRYQSKFISVDGMRTHYLEAGEGETIVLLHSGEFGGCAEISWEYLIPKLSKSYRVVAPDWLGFGKTAKIHDFDGKRARMISHMARFLETMAIDRAHFVANSMGATYLLQIAAELPCRFPIDKLVAIGGGGFVPANAERQRLLDYDGTEESMARVLEAIFEDPVWYQDRAYVQRRHALSIEPGAWEAVAAARFRSPVEKHERSEFGNADITPYQNISRPTLLVAGEQDRLRMPGFAKELVTKIRGAEAITIPDCGHCPNIEKADVVAEAVLEFLGRSQA
ncbi:alpha/beta fold hydrolase [Paraburkholderia silviterrae]|uniref:Alpha/beta hydrolase n=1 Tax=Paraburkholderia silviterrae TaxID=2528715 RepID=A0A4R5M0R7_9BURK|nr:alpha/beta hydrolase [Paraburkholderia silviterrae]TDG18772.1 alpha/beta hydrolase [Paraburkholderia silviterrae]